MGAGAGRLHGARCRREAAAQVQAGGGAVVGRALGRGAGPGGRRPRWVAGDGCKARATGEDRRKEGDGVLRDVFKTLWVFFEKKNKYARGQLFLEEGSNSY